MVLEGPGEQAEGGKTASEGTGTGGRWEWTRALPGDTRPEEKGGNW